jgi:tryptophan-rich sensory protein
VFAPVWIPLYTVIGIAAFIIWRRGAETPGRNRALIVFGIQLGLNALWTPVFFGLESPGGAALVIVALWSAIIVTIVFFWPLSRLAALLMVPYLLWVTYAAYLNIGIWWLNR